MGINVYPVKVINYQVPTPLVDISTNVLEMIPVTGTITNYDSETTYQIWCRQGIINYTGGSAFEYTPRSVDTSTTDNIYITASQPGKLTSAMGVTSIDISNILIEADTVIVFSESDEDVNSNGTHIE